MSPEREPRRYVEAGSCPNAAKHTPCPRQHVAWHEWAEKKLKTHRQVQCWTCGLFTIWVPR